MIDKETMAEKVFVAMQKKTLLKVDIERIHQQNADYIYTIVYSLWMKAIARGNFTNVPIKEIQALSIDSFAKQKKINLYYVIKLFNYSFDDELTPFGDEEPATFVYEPRSKKYNGEDATSPFLAEDFDESENMRSSVTIEDEADPLLTIKPGIVTTVKLRNTKKSEGKTLWSAWDAFKRHLITTLIVGPGIGAAVGVAFAIGIVAILTAVGITLPFLLPVLIVGIALVGAVIGTAIATGVWTRFDRKSIENGTFNFEESNSKTIKERSSKKIEKTKDKQSDPLLTSASDTSLKESKAQAPTKDLEEWKSKRRPVDDKSTKLSERLKKGASPVVEKKTDVTGSVVSADSSDDDSIYDVMVI